MALIFKRLIKDSGKTLIITDSIPEANIFTYQEGNLYLINNKIYYVGKSEEGVYSINEIPNQETVMQCLSDIADLKLSLSNLQSSQAAVLKTNLNTAPTERQTKTVTKSSTKQTKDK